MDPRQRPDAVVLDPATTVDEEVIVPGHRGAKVCVHRGRGSIAGGVVAPVIVGIDEQRPLPKTDRSIQHIGGVETTPAAIVQDVGAVLLVGGDDDVAAIQAMSHAGSQNLGRGGWRWPSGGWRHHRRACQGG